MHQGGTELVCKAISSVQHVVLKYTHINLFMFTLPQELKEIGSSEFNFLHFSLVSFLTGVQSMGAIIQLFKVPILMNVFISACRVFVLSIGCGLILQAILLLHVGPNLPQPLILHRGH